MKAPEPPEPLERVPKGPLRQFKAFFKSHPLLSSVLPTAQCNRMSLWSKRKRATAGFTVPKESQKISFPLLGECDLRKMWMDRTQVHDPEDV